MRQGIVLLMVIGLPLLTACGADAGGQRGASRESNCDNSTARHFLFSDPAWEFQEAVDYPGELRVPGGGAPIDWYAEYQRMTPIPGGTRGDSLSLMGHPIGVDAFREALPGWEPEERIVQGLRALAAPAPDDTPTIAAVAVDDDYTVGVVSYGLDIEELVGVAENMDGMCQREWLNSGGRMAECLPTDSSCLASTTTTTTSSARPR